ncbi:MAG: gamma-glutamyl-gamma-aminobutyrate hydrolase family protein [Verrucomicrobia bacterium]|nr:gamma-glutamyl-gamma-aminobutyrate hydrolase family protein [Verrucomicrobiota bacterium]
MKSSPLILISPSTESKGAEFGDTSISLSETYLHAIMAADAVPVVLPCTTSRTVIAECVRRCDGVMLTGGDDLSPQLYTSRLTPALRKTTLPNDPERDLRELLLIDEVFRQRKPLLAICRGHQMLNVALGGTLVVDIRRQLPDAINHRRMDKRNEVVHEARLTDDSLLAKITGRRTLGVNSTHHQAVARVARPLRVTASSADGVVEGMELKPEAAGLLPFLMAVQFHPERLVTRHPEHQTIFSSFTLACDLNRKKSL